MRIRRQKAAHKVRGCNEMLDNGYLGPRWKPFDSQSPRYAVTSFERHDRLDLLFDQAPRSLIETGCLLNNWFLVEGLDA